MSRIEGFKIERAPQRSAARWADLLRNGKRDQAAAQVAEETRKKDRATADAIDDQLQELARSRG